MTSANAPSRSSLQPTDQPVADPVDSDHQDVPIAWDRPPQGTRAVADRFLAVVERFPDRIACGDPDRSVTYQELHQLVTAGTQELAAVAGRGPVLLDARSTVSTAAALLAAASSGRSSLIIPSGADATGIAALAARTGASAAAQDGTIVPLGAARPGVSTTDAPDWSPVVLLLSTSGSTGDPKLIRDTGAVIAGRSLTPLDEGRTPVHVATPLIAASTLPIRLLQVLLNGDRLTGFRLDLLPVPEMLARLGRIAPTQLRITPSLLRRLVGTGPKAAATARPRSTEGVLTSVTEVLLIGEPVHWADVANARVLCGEHVTVANQYGSSEAGMIAERVVPPHEPLGSGPIPAGHIIPGRTVWISGEDGDPAVEGDSGRIVVDGMFTTLDVPFESLADGRQRWRSEDVGRIAEDGMLHVEGRADRMVKVAGIRVEPGAIESLLRDVPGVHDAAVVPVGTTHGERRLIAHVVVDPAAALDPTVLRQAISGQVTSMAMPARFLLRSEPLPLLPTGKVDLRALPAP
jgi:acyl-coenzyme A synthetase/AMP-(fatty) acid ligase